MVCICLNNVLRILVSWDTTFLIVVSLFCNRVGTPLKCSFLFILFLGVSEKKINGKVKWIKWNTERRKEMIRALVWSNISLMVVKKEEEWTQRSFTMQKSGIKQIYCINKTLYVELDSTYCYCVRSKLITVKCLFWIKIIS